MSLLKTAFLSSAILVATGAFAQPCLVGYTLTASTPPVNGTYPCGQTVTFCLTISSWNTTNANWFHGVVANFGPGWDMATLTPGAPPAPCGTGGGTWGWYASVQGTAGTALGPQGPGFFYDLNNDGNAGNNFGDFCTGPWTFCWTISVLSGPACVNGLGLGVSVNTFGDSETGSWGSSGCTGDAIALSQPAVIQSCAANAGVGGPLALCSTSPPVALFGMLGSNPDIGGAWTDPSGAPHTGSLDPALDPPGNYTYTVGTLVPPCSSSSVVAVSISTPPDAGVDGSLTLCASSAPNVLFTSLGGTPDAGGTWNGPGGLSSGIFDPSLAVPGAYVYTVAGTAPCVNASATVMVNVNASPNAGSNGVLTVCSNMPPVMLANSLGGAPSVNGTWTDPNNAAFAGIYVPGTSAPGAYTYTVIGTAPCPNSSATVTVAQNTAPNAGNDAAAILCSSSGTTTLTTLLNGSPQPGGIWTDPSGAVASNFFDPSSGSTGPYTYTVSGTAPCVDAQAILDLVITLQPDAGTSSVLNLCTASAPVDLFAALGGTPDGGGAWTDAIGAPVSSLFNPAVSGSGTFTYTVDAVAPCLNATATVDVNVSAQPSAGTNALLTVCSTGPAASLFTQLGPLAQPGGTWSDPNGALSNGSFAPGTSLDGTYTYTITGVAPCPDASATVDVSTTSAADPGIGLPLDLCSSGPVANLSASLGGTPGAGGTWTTPTGGASNGTINPATAASGPYTYTIAANGPCPAASTSVAVAITAQPSAGTNGAAQLCSTAPAAYSLINGLGGTPAANGAWTAPNGSPHAPTFAAGTDAPGAYTYTVSAPPPCVSVSSTVVMGVVQAANAGTGGSVSLCENDAAVDPFLWLAGSPNAGGTWTAPGGATITSIDPTAASSGVYLYTVVGTAPCPDAQAAMDVTIDPLPNAGTDSNVDLCADAGAQNLFVLLAGAQPGGSWSGPSGAASSVFQPGVHTPGTYTYTVSGNGACTSETDDATVDVSVLPVPVPSFSLDSAAGCVPHMVVFTNNDPAGTATAQWSFGDGAASNGITGVQHSYTAGGNYDVTLQVTNANGCTGAVTMAGAVTVSDGPDALFYALPQRVSVNNPVTQVTHLAVDGISYNWTLDSSVIDTSGNFSWTFSPAVVGYHPICLTATDALGCENTYCTEVLVDDDLTIYVPNAFTPNGDDDNDSFRPSVIGVEKDWYRFMIFDRWGLLVFSTTDPYEAWNGGFGNAGEVLPDGVYVWTLKAKDQFTPEKADLIGTVTLWK
ncbi:MAG: gliding motility-associated C-terminal domain-containing protein [Flavobacteriales bacterium]|nr:gliding motility-associated C-terminal domain-containing protein [Flavobacteriales bacterium]